jgi:hypothetical protein
MSTTLARFSRAALCALALSGASHAFAQLILTNSPAWNGGDYITPFGEPEIATVGQTFTADAAHSELLGFTFFLKSDTGGGVDFHGFVSEWDGTRLTGPLLFSSELRTLPVGTNLFQPVTFDTGSLLLTPGAHFVAFLSASGAFDSVDGTAGVGVPVFVDTYLGGSLVVALNGDDFDALSESPWEEIFGMDIAFRMEFAGGAVPELASFGVIGAIALFGLAGARRVRRGNSSK